MDAAVAVGFALAVTHPFAGNIGGGGFMLARFADGRTTFIDFRERAPANASRNMYLDADGKATKDSIVGWRASGVPGTVRGFEIAHKKYGHKKWAEVLAPAIRLASKGFPVSYGLMRSLKSSKLLDQFPESKRIFLNDGNVLRAGDVFVQPELARTLERISRHGAKDFYEGETARLLAEDMAEHGGLITLDDLKNYTAVERQAARPGTTRLHDHHVAAAEFRRHRDPADARHARGHRLREGRRRLGRRDPLPGRGDAPLLRRPQRVSRRSRFRQGARSRGCSIPRTSAKLRASIDPDRATPSDEIRPGKLGPARKHRDHALFRRRRRGQRRSP